MSSVPGPSSSPQSRRTEFYPSSTVKVSQHLAEHKRDEVEQFEDIYVVESTDDTTFFKFLGDDIRWEDSKGKFSLKTFVKAANALAKSMRDACEFLLPLDT
jgi:hypothetical protein